VAIDQTATRAQAVYAVGPKLQSVQFSKAERYRRHDWITFRAFRNTSDPRDLAITDRRQTAPLPTDAPLDLLCDVRQPVEGRSFGVRDISQLHQHLHVPSEPAVWHLCSVCLLITGSCMGSRSATG
jgi:hypothetical protein